jgi:uncharacterized OB-fold protein
MTPIKPFTIESFYNFIKQQKLMAAKCRTCKQLLLPPKPMCPECFSNNLEWKELKPNGKLLTYTIIHISPQQFQKLTPYAVGIVELDENVQLPGIIRNVDLAQVQVGMKLVMGFDTASISEEWPQWPRYYFKPMA